MPPKEKTELQVINLDNLNPALLPELATFKEKQLQVAQDNPFIKIVDSASRELAKKHRTARVSARTSLQNQDKLISSKLNDAKTKVKGYIAELIAYTQPGEIEQQKEIDRDEAEAELKRQEKARIEQQRIDKIKSKLEEFSSQWKTAFNLMTFETINQVSGDFLESYTTFDLSFLEEFEPLFPIKIEELTQFLSDKTESLTIAENARIEKEKIEAEAKELERKKSEFEAEQKRIAAENLKISQENDRKLKEIADAQAKLDADKKLIEPKVVEEIIKVDGYSTSETTYPEKVETVEILESVKTTANVCYDLPKEPTWESIEDDFKESGEKSYSKWLKENFNAPTKKQ